jgi:hypothetical protein
MRPTGLSSPIDQHFMDYTVYSGEWPMGRIYEERGSTAHQRWFWSLFGILANAPDMRINGRAPTLEAAKAEFETNWQQWLEGAKLGEVPESHGPPPGNYGNESLNCN